MSHDSAFRIDGPSGTPYQLACLFLSLAWMCTPCWAEDWPQFLGSHRDGIARDSGQLVREFPATGPKIVWRVDGGVGMSGISIADNRCFTIVRRNQQQTLVALDRLSGKLLWQSALAPSYKNAMGDGARATPTVSGNAVFCMTGEGVLAAGQVGDGKLLWSRNLPQELGGKPSEYGMSCSPLIVDELVIVQVGAPQAAVVAVSRQTGQTVWTAGSGAAGYSSPALLNVAGESQVVAFCGQQCLGIDPEDGTIQWSFPFATDYDCNTATPLEIDGQVLISAGENQGSTLLQVTPQAGVYQVKSVWESFGNSSSLRSEWQTPMHLGDLLFGFDNQGSAGPITNLSCVDVKTGAALWKKTRFGKSNGIVADGKLIISTMNGELVLVDASPVQFTELARAKVLGQTRQAPALADGRVYLRDDTHVLCISLRAEDY